MNKQHAFPTTELSYNRLSGATVEVQKEGMSLRDYFAAQALPSIITLYEANALKDKDHAARIAYSFADEMMKARE